MKPLSRRIDLKEVVCARMSERADATVRVQRLLRWGEELEIYTAPGTLFLPDYLIQLWNGFAPLEAVNYEYHFQMAQNGVPHDRWSFDPACADRVDQEVCILANPCSRTFGHWTEELLKVLILEEGGFRGKYVLTPSPSRVWYESLELLGVGRDRTMVVERPTLFAAAVFTTVVHHFVAHKHRGVFHALRDRLHAATPHATGSGERIWISRGAGATTAMGRDVLNHEEVDTLLRHYGFAAVDFGSLNFAQQIGVDRDARFVAGPHGSAMVHVGFMSNGSSVVELFHPHFINASVIQLCLAFDHSYRQVVSDNTPYFPYDHAGIMVDIDRLQLALHDLREPQGVKSGSAA